jgi:ribosomal protein S1
MIMKRIVCRLYTFVYTYFLVKKFTPGSEHNCRIIAYHSIERLLIVSTKKEVLKQKILSSEHAKPGQKVTATIAEIKPAGLLVELGEDLRGLVPKMHVLDRETSVWAKHFKQGRIFLNGLFILCYVILCSTIM